jgi:hypothetical protein
MYYYVTPAPDRKERTQGTFFKEIPWIPWNTTLRGAATDFCIISSTRTGGWFSGSYRTPLRTRALKRSSGGGDGDGGAARSRNGKRWTLHRSPTKQDDSVILVPLSLSLVVISHTYIWHINDNTSLAWSFPQPSPKSGFYTPLQEYCQIKSIAVHMYQKTHCQTLR